MSKITLQENRKEEVPFAHYLDKFRALNPEEVVCRVNAQWREGEFLVEFLQARIAVAHPEYALRQLDSDRSLDLRTQTFLLRYLTEGSEVPWLGNWRSFREMDWGEVYYVPFSGRILRRAAFAFGNCPDKYMAAAEKLGGLRVRRGSALTYEFELLPGYLIRLQIWPGDEEFPPNAQVLYSDNFQSGFTAEDRVVAAEILIGMLQSQMK